jgi:hypothetical protein
MKLNQTCLAAAVLTISAAASQPAAALDRYRFPAGHAAAFCQASLPAFEGLVRKRPLAVQNEGASTAYITCSFPMDQGATVLEGMIMMFVNNTSGNLPITCTMVTGSETLVTYLPATKVAAPGYTSQPWYPGNGNMMVSFNCALPPGTGIHYIYAATKADVGA